MQEENTYKKEEKGIKTELDTQSMEGVLEYAQGSLSNFDAHENLIGFFSLLLQVDKRMNPQNYKQ